MSNVPATMTTCPNEETLAAFIDGRLEQDARSELIEHIAGCAECRDVMAAARELEMVNEDEGSSSSTVRQFPRKKSYLPAAVVAALAASVAVVFLRVPLRDWWAFQSSGGLTAVVKASESVRERPVESRLSGGYSYRPFKGVPRGTNEEQGVNFDNAPLWEVADELKDAEQSGSWRRLHAAAMLQLLLGDRKQALALMEKAEGAGGNSDPGFLTDLGAVYLEQARYNDGPKALDRAVAATQRAWTVSKTPESAWNRALALELAGRTAGALGAWQAYLKQDSDPNWVNEAQTHIQQLQPPSP